MRQSQFAADVRRGLGRPGQKQLPPHYFYDDLGTTLFEAITLLPEYGLTRADIRLIRSKAPELAARCAGAARLVELGSGTGSKTRPILSAFQSPPQYIPVDVSQAALDRCRGELEGFAVHGIRATYLDGLDLALRDRPAGVSALVLFLGSTIGNFERDAIVPFLGGVRRCLRNGDHLLLGADLVKDIQQLLAAYDDPLGITAAFNLNVLARINRELDSDFDLRKFRHEARWNAACRRIEMHLRSACRQTVCVPAIHEPVSFEEGETIWTESSHKFELNEICEMGALAGFRCEARWVDEEWPFAEILFVAQ